MDKENITIEKRKYNTHLAIIESSKCLMCYDAPCQDSCPANVKVSQFLRQIRTGDFLGAAKTIREDNIFASTCARICPTELLCQKHCNYSKIDKPIDIPGLQQYVCDLHLKQGLLPINKLPKIGKSVAVVGTGPGGLAAAFEFKKLGYNVTVFEKSNYAGGMLKSCLPTYRLPKEILSSEISFIIDYGVEIIFNKEINKLTEFKKDYEAVFLSVGLPNDTCLDIPGNNLDGVMTALDFLSKEYIYNNLKLGKSVAIIGGGDIAMDCARTAIRHNNVDIVHIIYRRSTKEMPAQIIERRFAEQEGVIFHNLLVPYAIEGEKTVKKLICKQTELSKFGEDKRRIPVVIDNTSVIFDVDNVIFAIGQQPSNNFMANNPDLQTNKKGYIIINPDTCETSIKGIFAGGDITGGTSAIEAIGNAKKAVKSIHSFLSRSK